MTLRVGFLTTHPIQYQVPVFRHLANDDGLDFTVYFCQIPDAAMQGAEFNVPFQWDLPLLEGYRYEVLKNVSRTPGVMQFSGCDTPEIGSIIRQGNFDAFVINGWNVKSCLQALWACRRAGVPCLVRGEANDLRPRAWWKRGMQRALVQQYAGCLAIGRANAEFYRVRGVPERRLFSAPYCVENDRFASAGDPPRRAAAREKWRIPADRVCYLFSGKFIDKKHPLELLHAFKDADIGGQAVLLMVGDGPLRAECEALVRKHNLAVTFAGFLNQGEILDAYDASDCLVLPSDAGETWGLVVNEAMAAGKPALVSHLAGCSQDLVADAGTGEIFPFGYWTAFSRLFKHYSVRSDELQQMGQRARTHIAQYSPQVAANGIINALHTVVRPSHGHESASDGTGTAIQS